MPETRPQIAGWNPYARCNSPRPGDSSLPRTARLLDGKAFERVFAAPTRSADRYFTVLSRERCAGDVEAADGNVRLPIDCGARLGLAISKRCAARAVARNRIKRVIRESFRHARGGLPEVDVVVMCRRAAADADKRTLRASLDTHWKRVCK